MKEFRTTSFVAVDGRVFTGDNAKENCEKYEADTLKSIENRLKNEKLGVIYIDHSTEDIYILARNDHAIELINIWLGLKNIRTDYGDCTVELDASVVGNVVKFTAHPNGCIYFEPVRVSTIMTNMYDKIKMLSDISSTMQYRYGVYQDTMEDS